MKSRVSSEARTQRPKNVQGEGPNWVLVVGGALLSTLSVRLGFKLKQALDSKHQDNSILKGNERTAGRRLGNCRSNSSLHSYGLDENNCYNCASGSNYHKITTFGERITEVKSSSNGPIMTEPEVSLPLVTVPTPEYSMVWVSSPERGDPPPKPFQHSSNSDSPCVSESGSDMFSKRDVIQKLRQQLKRRDDLIVEMQDQIAELQNALNAQMSHSENLQSQLDATNKELFDSEREIQRLRKAIADHCLAHGDPNEKLSATTSPAEKRNGHANGYLNGDANFGFPEKSGDDERIQMLKKEIRGLKKIIEGKEYLLEGYKEQKDELSSKIKELQQRLDSQLPHIL
ncbi:uncharacterized protein LOC110715448 isoform X1 [Chenopodium quinoa]|uniref:uncharacterized protein LOC110715448 isoform X1 n=1 Tax=Chenopodium quinoa TaxID=63459 RepID=UPI000B784F34|nr:uncharacterized protein LOC110715448 isoform X1 [Chenopodium quinoa]